MFVIVVDTFLYRFLVGLAGEIAVVVVSVKNLQCKKKARQMRLLENLLVVIQDE